MSAAYGMYYRVPEFQQCKSLKSISGRDIMACPCSTAACHVSITSRAPVITRTRSCLLSYLSPLLCKHLRRQFVDIAPQSPSSFTSLTSRLEPVLCVTRNTDEYGVRSTAYGEVGVRSENFKRIACATPSLAIWSLPTDNPHYEELISFRAGGQRQAAGGCGVLSASSNLRLARFEMTITVCSESTGKYNKIK